MLEMKEIHQEITRYNDRHVYTVWLEQHWIRKRALVHSITLL